MKYTHKNAIKLRERGYSYGEIANKFGISRARAHQICNHYQTLRKRKRKEILERDKNTCRRCGSGRKLEVHHKDKDSHNNEDYNLITLCRLCHCLVDKFFV